MNDADLAAMFAEMADAAGVTLTVAMNVCDAIDPTLTRDQRYTAVRHAATLCPVQALAFATTFAAGMLAARYESDPDGLARAMHRIRVGAAGVV